ncbi:MAG: alpha/beta hydrolase-fold protein [Phycisphaerales bacterium]
MQSANGRLVVFLVAGDSSVDPHTLPIEGPFWESEQPLFGMDITALTPGASIAVDDRADAYPGKPSALKPGRYRAQACLLSNHQDSNWKRVDGNLFSDVGELVIDPKGNGAVHLALSHKTLSSAREQVEGVEWFTVPSKLLTTFRGEPTQLRAGVVFPIDYDPSRKYATIYRVPGFGGDDLDAPQYAHERAESKGASRELAKETFLIILNPEGPNGHTLFADSANNGPCSRALTEELIPALEKKFPIIAKPEGRMLLGHSSGGWSTLWLALSKPDVFGATWTISPDPVDFRKFQTVNIYNDKNFYAPEAATDGKSPTDRPSFREFDRATGKTREVMTIRREARQEDVLGPNNTSAQQWDSWFAVFGPRDAAGHPAALFDPATGVIDHATAEKYRVYDIGSFVREDPSRYLPLFNTNVHLVVGGADSFYLNEAVALLQADLARLQPHAPAAATGYIKIVPKYDHGTILGSPEVRGFSEEMLTFLGKAGAKR